MLDKEDPTEWGLELTPNPEPAVDVRKKPAEIKHFVHRVYKLVPLTELERKSYASDGDRSNHPPPEFREELVSERFFEGIG